MDILNKLDPMPCGFGPAIKPAAKPAAAELREKELREFETRTDALVWFGADFGEAGAAAIGWMSLHAEMRQRLIDDFCGIPPCLRSREYEEAAMLNLRDAYKFQFVRFGI